MFVAFAVWVCLLWLVVCWLRLAGCLYCPLCVGDVRWLDRLVLWVGEFAFVGWFDCCVC